MTPGVARLHRRVAAAIPAGVERWPVDDQAAWHARRQGDVTASVAAALLGAHEFTTFYSLWHTKAGNLPRSTDDTPAMRRGRLLEDDALQVIAEDNPSWHVAPCGFYYRAAADRLGGTPDAIAFDPLRDGFGIVQIKSVEPTIFRTKWSVEDGIPTPPLWIVVQAAIEAWLTGASWAAEAPIVVGHGIDVPVIEVPVHAGVLAKLRRLSAEFWASVEAGVAPEPDYRTDGAAIAALWPEDNGIEADLSADNELPALLDEHDSLALRLRADAKRIEEIKAAVRHKLGPNASARAAGGRRITNREQTRKGHFVEGGTSRVLRIGSRQDG